MPSLFPIVASPLRRPASARASLPALLFFLLTACPSGTDATSGGGGEAGNGGEAGKGGEAGSTTDGGGGNGGETAGGGGSGGETTGGMGGVGGVGGSGGAGGAGGGPIDPNYPPETEPNGSLNTANPLQDNTLGFTAELSSLNDVDIFSFFAPLGSTVSVAISDGMGGCPADATVKLDIYDPFNLEISTQTGLCPVIDGTVDTDLASVAVEGLYFARITAPAAVSSYVVEISVNPPICGDGIIQLGEECDDMNMVAGDGCENDCTETPVCGDGTVQSGEECDDSDMMSGDGCDSMCQLEGNYCPEGEPNNTIMDATLLTTCDGGAGEISVAGDQDYYEVVVTVPGSSIRAEVLDILGTTCPAGFDSVITLFNSTGTQLGSDDEDGINGCSLIHPAAEQAFAPDAFAQNLPAGSYFIRVDDFLNNGTSPPYVLKVDVNAPGCGDSIPQIGEECDDGNNAPGDGCSATCEVEGNYCVEAEPNNDTISATPLAGCDGGTGAINPTADGDYYSLVVTVPNSSIRAETVNTTGAGCPTNANTIIRLFNSAGTELGSDDEDGNLSCSLINPTIDNFARNLPTGTYFLKVEESGNNATIPPYILKALVLAPGCGDNIIQAGEECDDGNMTSGDGCDDMCFIEGDFCAENEPNDSFGAATPLTACSGGSGQINYVADSDWFRFDVTNANSSVRIEVTNTTGSGCPAGFDSFVRLYNSSMVQLGTDNDDGADLCSLINPGVDAFAASVPVGTYYVRVNENGDDATGLPYLVYVTVSQPGCGDSIIQAGEACDDGNMIDNDGCSNSCAVLSCGPGETLLQYSAMGLPSPSFDSGTPTSSTINVPDMGNVTRLVVGVNIQHTWNSDVTLNIDAPNAAPVELTSGNGGSSDNYTNTFFSSQASNSITGGTAPFTGVFAPEASMMPIIGTSATGAWVLNASDSISSDSGTITGYTLSLCVTP